MFNYDEVQETCNYLDQAIRENEDIIKTLPRGKFLCYKNNNKYKWYSVSLADDKGKIKRKYIPRTDEQLAEKLAFKGYLEAQAKTLREELLATKSYLRRNNGRNYAEEYLARSPEHLRLVNAARIRLSSKADQEVREWLASQTTSAAPNKENLLFMSQAGYKVRSKSEQIIVAALMRYDIPFKYEQCIYSSGAQIFPDFMIMHPRTHKIYIWEHLGMMDNEKYRNHNIWKLGEYAKIGFIPGDNLILTYETRSSGCDEVLVDYYIRHYLQ